MTPKPSRLGHRPLGGENDPYITVEPNVDTECFTIRQADDTGGPDELIHFCDWPAMRATIDQFMKDREEEP